MRKVTAHASVVIAVAAGMVGAGLNAAAAEPTTTPQVKVSAEATGIRVRHLDVPAVDSAARQSSSDRSSRPTAVARLVRRNMASFSLVAVTWASGSDGAEVIVRVRVRSRERWTPWRELYYEQAADTAAPEASSGHREGTEPLWVGEADGVEVRVSAKPGSASASMPDDISVATIDPGTAPADNLVQRQPAPAYLTDDSAGIRMPVTGTADARRRPQANRYRHVPRPRLVTRRQWGADRRFTSYCGTPPYGKTIKSAIVHHTATGNSYSESDAPAIVRSIYAYHTRSLGWCDIGYNFLVDRYGNVYVGRRGGVSRPVRGAHAADWNTDSVGVSLIGNFEEGRPTRRLRGGLVRVVAWKLQSNYRGARGRVWLAGKRVRTIAAHRDVMSTLCPGRYMIARLPRIRARVANVMGSVNTPIRRKWVAKYGGRGGSLGSPFVGERRLKAGGGHVTRFTRGQIYWQRRPGAHMLNGRILRHYRSDYRGPRGRLGYPTEDAQASKQPGMRVAGFQRGRIYVARRDQAVALWGPILERYRKAGGVISKLGGPLSRPRRIPGGRRASFRNGWIYYDRSSDTTAVRYR